MDLRSQQNISSFLLINDPSGILCHLERMVLLKFSKNLIKYTDLEIILLDYQNNMKCLSINSVYQKALCKSRDLKWQKLRSNAGDPIPRLSIIRRPISAMLRKNVCSRRVRYASTMFARRRDYQGRRSARAAPCISAFEGRQGIILPRRRIWPRARVWNLIRAYIGFSPVTSIGDLPRLALR